MRIASLLLWLTGPALAAPVELPCPYEAGATHRWAKQSVGAAGEVEQLVSVTVAEATEALVTFEVQAELERVEARDPVLVHMTRALAAQGIRPRVVLDRAAGTLALANGAELQPAYVAAGEAAVAALEAEGAPESVRKVVPQLVADPALMEQSVIRDLTPLLALGCGALEPGEQRYDTALPSPFGGTPLPAQGTLTVVDADGALTVRNVETIAPDALAARAMEAMTGIAVQVDGATEADKAAALKLLGGARFTAGTELETVLDRHTGWVRRLASTRTVRGPGQERVDRVVFSERPTTPPPR